MAAATPAAVQSAGTGGAAGGSALKIVLIVVGAIFVIGAVSLGGMYYAAHRYLKMAEDVTGINAGDALHSIREAAARNAHGSPESKRDGCLLLSAQEASAILEVEVIRIDGKPNEHESGEHCDFFVKPESIEQNMEKLRKAADAIKSDPNSPAQPDKLPPGAADMLKTFSRGVAEGAGNGEAPYFGFTVERENGKLTLTAFQMASRLSGVAAVSDADASAPLNVGDHAAMGIGDSRLCVVKGNLAVTLDLSQVPQGRAKGVALARQILSRL